MIAKLSGLLDSIGDDHALVDVGGVGYLVFCSARTLRTLPRVGDATSLFVETHVREDHIHLYGFSETAERDWFRLLQTVQGVGARVALGILSVLTPGQLVQAIAAQDKSPLTKANGVGGRVAERIVNELKGKIGALASDGGSANVETFAPAGLPSPGSAADDAISALVNLGYRRVEAFGAVTTAGQRIGPDATVEALITSGLRELAQ